MLFKVLTEIIIAKMYFVLQKMFSVMVNFYCKKCILMAISPLLVYVEMSLKWSLKIFSENTH